MKSRVRSATDTTAVFLGAYAGLLGMVHGLLEISQGRIVADSALINAVGAPCRPDEMWHGCLPAMTVIPNVFVTGALAMAVGLALLLAAIWLVGRRRSGLILVLLSILLLLVGGGFVPALAGLLAGTAVTKLPITLIPLPRPILHVGATLWPCALIVFVVWALGGWILGYFFNQVMLNLGGILFVIFDLGLPLVCVLSAIAVEEEKTAEEPV